MPTIGDFFLKKSSILYHSLCISMDLLFELILHPHSSLSFIILSLLLLLILRENFFLRFSFWFIFIHSYKKFIQLRYSTKILDTDLSVRGLTSEKLPTPLTIFLVAVLARIELCSPFPASWGWIPSRQLLLRLLNQS